MRPFRAFCKPQPLQEGRSGAAGFRVCRRRSFTAAGTHERIRIKWSFSFLFSTRKRTFSAGSPLAADGQGTRDTDYSSPPFRRRRHPWREGRPGSVPPGPDEPKFHPEMVFLAHLGANLHVCLCGDLQVASAQRLDFLDIGQKSSFPDWKPGSTGKSFPDGKEPTAFWDVMQAGAHRRANGFGGRALPEKRDPSSLIRSRWPTIGAAAIPFQPKKAPRPLTGRGLEKRAGACSPGRALPRTALTSRGKFARFHQETG